MILKPISRCRNGCFGAAKARINPCRKCVNLCCGCQCHIVKGSGRAIIALLMRQICARDQAVKIARFRCE